MKVLSAIRKEKDEWVFDYLGGHRPELRSCRELARPFPTTMAGMHGLVLDGTRWSIVASLPHGLNSEAALTAVQVRLLGWGWSLRPKMDL